jgi:chromosome segregation ATPase
MVQIKELENVITTKDTKIAEVEKEKDQIKEKLHLSYKEFLNMNEKIVRLQKEAEHGSDPIISRNEVLQRNLDKLSRDFEQTAKELNSFQTKTRELEFELEEMVSQFNMTGEAKRIAEELNVKLTSELDILTKNHKELRKIHEATTLHEQQLERDLMDLKILQVNTKRDLEEKAALLTEELEIVKGLKLELEVNLKATKIEVEKLSSNLKSMTRSKEQLEVAFRNAVQKHEKEVATKDDRIEELMNHKTEDDKTIKRLQESKEQLMFQVTDLQNALDRESANVNMMTFEIAQLKRTGEEKVAMLEEQLEKLNAAKVNLANDKRQLTDKIRLVRSDLKKKEEEYDALSIAFDKFKEEANATDSSLRAELHSLHAAHTTLTGEHKSLERRQAMVMESNVELTINLESFKKKLSAKEEQNVQTEALLTAERSANAQLTSDLEKAVSEKSDIQIYLDSILGKLEETNQILSQERDEFSATLKEKTDIITKTSADLYNVQEEEKRLTILSQSLKRNVNDLEKELGQTKIALEAETHNKEQFEMHLYDLRRNLNSERKSRLEFERVHSKLNRMSEAREMERLAAQRLRDRKLEELSKNLQLEYSRLKAVSGLLPTDNGAPILETPEIPSFSMDHSSSSHKPDVRVTVTKR